MLGDFSCKNATKLYFGADSLKYLTEELIEAVSGATVIPQRSL